ncbi:MAG: riboflavin kinase, partial [Solirubrobacteraceae bacterium]
MIASITGPVVHGEQRGRDLGFPTANMRLAEDDPE